MRWGGGLEYCLQVGNYAGYGFIERHAYIGGKSVRNPQVSETILSVLWCTSAFANLHVLG